MKIVHDVPSVEEYIRLRKLAGMGERDANYVQQGLDNSYFSVTLRNENNELIGMGRVIGDGGTAYFVVDIAVHPDEQGNGLGKIIMKEIKQYLDTNINKKAFVSLIADKPAHHLYEKFGFEAAEPESMGMEYNRE
ncbi:N-acetyltransferase [Lysinibacillus alkalisoli]|uniref:N-acetyltransferase n=1 Tax=Lysinibacillus alkalisoli TaxID=1911548 RepID=A0A917G6T6_9BACI|nr:GNAT family N-acetyltransferase [Lysinibacillus alkalisoli]GGG25889.1 N-acetyltransferase [Lysinibacillus alkalisoli]